VVTCVGLASLGVWSVRVGARVSSWLSIECCFCDKGVLTNKAEILDEWLVEHECKHECGETM
jgi:hypothetical protein